MFTYRIKIVISIILALLLAGCANSTRQAQQKSDIPAFSGKTTFFQRNEIRLHAISETARSVGAQAGLAWQAKHYNKLLDVQNKTLAQAYNFRALILNHDVLPPILEEGRNTLNLDSDSTIRLSDRDYKIIQPARFVTTVPTWRDYLWMNYPPPDAPDNTLLPKTNQERDVWNHYVAIGWHEGAKQAQDIFNINLNRLTRDYQGMILYHKLLAQHIVSPPYVSRSNLGITGDNNNLHINDRILRITSMAKFRANSKLWKSRIRTKYPISLKKRKKSVVRAYG